jgi:putative PIG3 family NAD(P)H quinone oxidoreductase
MRAIEIAQPGGPEVLRVVERPIPVPSAGEVLIAVRAAGVCRADAQQRAGKYPPPPGAPDIPGLEVAGVIEETGERVCALLAGGGYAEYAVAPRALVLPVPENWSFVEAASLPENAFTVYDNVFTRARFQDGESVLIHGGSSGVGTTAIMLARAFGARFIAVTAGSDAKCAACVELGADLAINYKASDFVTEVKKATDGNGVDVILDIVGGDYLARDLDALAPDGRITCIATPGGRTAELDIAKVMQRRAAVMGSALRARSTEQKAQIARRLHERVWPLLPARNPIRPVIEGTFRLEDAAQAHRRLEESVHIGKIVLVTETNG